MKKLISLIAVIILLTSCSQKTEWDISDKEFKKIVNEQQELWNKVERWDITEKEAEELLKSLIVGGE